MNPENSVKNKEATKAIKLAISRLIKGEMAKSGFKYKDLQEKLRDKGVELSEANLRGKVNKGLIPSDLLLMILSSLDVESIIIEEVLSLANKNV